MKRKLTLILVVLVLFSVPAAAKKKSEDYRQTVFVTAGKNALMFEAPDGMCFLDQNDPLENTIYKVFRDNVQQKNDQVLLAVFTACNRLNDLGEKTGTNDIPFNAGTISWLNSAIGATTPLKRPEYLDMRATTFHEYVEGTPPALGLPHLDDTPHRTEADVALGLSGDLNIDDKTFKGTAVLATTSIRNVPIEVMIRYTTPQPYPLGEIYQQMDKFLAWQITLNE